MLRAPQTQNPEYYAYIRNIETRDTDTQSVYELHIIDHPRRPQRDHGNNVPCRERQTYQTPVRSIPRRRDATLVARHDLSDPLRFGAQGRRRSRQASRGAFQIAAGVGDRGVFGGDASPRHGDNRLFGHTDA